VVKIQSIKNNKLCKTKPISEKPKMNLTPCLTMTNNKKQRTTNYSKQSQTKPILPAIAGKIAPLLRMPFILMGPASSWIPAFAGMTKTVLVVILEIEVHIPRIRQTFLFGQLDLRTLQICPAKLKRREKFSKFCYVNLL
jgi:hypothetical protein